jgi:hypothetical protein
MSMDISEENVASIFGVEKKQQGNCVKRVASKAPQQ